VLIKSTVSYAIFKCFIYLKRKKKKKLGIGALTGKLEWDPATASVPTVKLFQVLLRRHLPALWKLKFTEANSPEGKDRRPTQANEKGY
jgi:hypothetical protein